MRASFKQDGPKLRVTLTSPTSREVKWSIHFESAKSEITPPPAVTDLKATADHRGVTLTWAADGAEGYRIECNDGVVFETTANTITDTLVQNGTTYRYQVTALGWNHTVSPPVSVEITPKQPERPATPPAPTIHLGDLKPSQVKNGWGTHVPDKEIGGAMNAATESLPRVQPVARCAGKCAAIILQIRWFRAFFRPQPTTKDGPANAEPIP